MGAERELKKKKKNFTVLSFERASPVYAVGLKLITTLTKRIAKSGATSSSSSSESFDVVGKQTGSKNLNSPATKVLLQQSFEFAPAQSVCLSVFNDDFIATTIAAAAAAVVRNGQ